MKKLILASLLFASSTCFADKIIPPTNITCTTYGVISSCTWNGGTPYPWTNNSFDYPNVTQPYYLINVIQYKGGKPSVFYRTQDNTKQISITTPGGLPGLNPDLSAPGHPWEDMGDYYTCLNTNAYGCPFVTINKS